MVLAGPETPGSRRANRKVDRAVAAVENGTTGQALPAAGVERAVLMYVSFAFFMSELKNEAGDYLRVDVHTEEWCGYFQNTSLLCLLAPRDHGKSVTNICYLLWRVWRHNRDPLTGDLMRGNPMGKFEAVLFSDTVPQAEIFFETFQNIMLANPDIFADIAPGSHRGDVWSKRRVRLVNLASVIIRGYRTSTRGLHPDLIVLDDVLNDQNTLTQYQRDKVWRYFVGTLIPMNAKQYVIIGTAFHRDDLLHRLAPVKDKPVVLTVGNRRVRFTWKKYRSINWDTKTVLWPFRHDAFALAGQRSLDALLFAREMQNDPVDDASSMFPTTLTGKAKRPDLQFQPVFARDVGEYVIGGMDVAISNAVGADYTVLWVATWNRFTGRCRVLWGVRERGLEFDQQVDLLKSMVRTYGIDLVIVEENNFQKWLHQRLSKLPETAGRVLGHRTGQEKADFTDGVPSLRLVLENQLWDWPTGDEKSAELFAIWQEEMAAYGWKDGKLMGVGQHDDTVMAWYMLDRARKLIEEWTWKAESEGPEQVWAEDMGIEPVRIGKDF